jgi:hypothetical protein
MVGQCFGSGKFLTAGCAGLGSVQAEPVRGALAGSLRGACLGGGLRPGVARHASPFLLGRQKKGTKEKATLLSATPSLRYGATWGARSRGAPQNSLRAGALRSNNCGESDPGARALRRACHPVPCAPQAHTEGNPGSGHPHGPLLRCAALGRAVAARGACARESGAEQSDGPCGCLAVHPLLAAPAAGRLRGGMGALAPMLRDLTRRGCPSGAAQQQSEFHGAPRNRPAAGLPRSEAQGSQTGGRLFFAYFLLAKQKKVSRRRATPGSRHPTRHAAKQRARERTPVPTSSARTADKVPRPRKDPTQQQHNRYYFNSFPRLSIKAQSLKGHKTEGHPSVGIHLADEPDLQRFNLTEIGAALAAKGYFSPLRGLCTANAVTSFQLLLKSGFLFLRKILQPATRSSPLPR